MGGDETTRSLHTSWKCWCRSSSSSSSLVVEEHHKHQRRQFHHLPVSHHTVDPLMNRHYIYWNQIFKAIFHWDERNVAVGCRDAPPFFLRRIKPEKNVSKEYDRAPLLRHPLLLKDRKDHYLLLQRNRKEEKRKPFSWSTVISVRRPNIGDFLVWRDRRHLVEDMTGACSNS